METVFVEMEECREYDTRRMDSNAIVWQIDHQDLY
jgi:hypothetical protein